MFLITDHEDYLCGSPYFQNYETNIWFTKNKDNATKYTLEQCFIMFENFTELKKENFTCIEVEE